jgi:hypothetical protein
MDEENHKERERVVILAEIEHQPDRHSYSFEQSGI